MGSCSVSEPGGREELSMPLEERDGTGTAQGPGKGGLDFPRKHGPSPSH